MTHSYYYTTGAAVGLDGKTLPGLRFDLNAAYTGCLICGEVFQSRLDRRVLAIQNDSTHPMAYLLDSYAQTAKRLRQEWAAKHSKLHTEKQHMALKASGQMMTPEAALKLTPMGVIPIQPNVEVAAAMLEAPRKPYDDAED